MQGLPLTNNGKEEEEEKGSMHPIGLFLPTPIW